MDKKAKKRIEVLRAKLQKLRVVLSAAKQQADDRDEVQNIQHEIAKVEAELATLTR